MMSLTGRRVWNDSQINTEQDQLSSTNNFSTRKAKQVDLSWRLTSHLLLLFLLGNLQGWWVGEGGGLTVGAVLHLGHLDTKTKRVESEIQRIWQWSLCNHSYFVGWYVLAEILFWTYNLLYQERYSLIIWLSNLLNFSLRSVWDWWLWLEVKYRDQDDTSNYLHQPVRMNLRLIFH